MFSQTVEYTLRAAVFLADQPEQAQTVQQIAAATRVPAPYLAKLLQQLARQRLVNSQRGIGGGFTLARAPENVTIWDIVEAVEPIRRIRTCPLDLKAHQTKLCPLHKRMDDALAHIEAAFRASTLAEVLAEPTTSKPLCDFPQRPPSEDGGESRSSTPGGRGRSTGS